jgi:cyclin H
MKLTEDDIYRSSTQFRNWSFTPAQLAEQRQKTNQQASERVKAAVARQRAQRTKQPQNDTPSASENERNGSGVDTGSNTPLTAGDNEVDCLTVAEEMKLVDTFCDKALELGGVFFKFPHEVTVSLTSQKSIYTGI